jgi:putative phosphoesterase
MPPIPRNQIKGRRFGLLADTHDNKVAWPETLQRIRTALGTVDGIIHCGDLCTRQALDDLAGITPVWAVRSSVDPMESVPELVEGPRILQVGDVQIGIVNSLSAAPIKAEVSGDSLCFPHAGGAQVSSMLFGGSVDVCVFGGSHKAAVAVNGGTLFVNPGSPSLAEKKSVGILIVDQGTVSVEIIAIP